MPYLHNASFFDVRTLLLAISAILFHYFSFGHNSLMDAAMGYDEKDPSKKHHPLISGAIKLGTAHNVIHWGLGLLTAWATLLTLWISPNPAALGGLILWIAFGHSYNDGLSKESLTGFLSISICCTASSAWGWFLSHNNIDAVGMIYLAYVFLTILYQISYSGFVKEIAIGEKSNILTRMGATLESGKTFKPNRSAIYACSIKGFTLILASWLLWLHASPVRLVMFVLLITSISFMLYKTTRPRIYKRGKELLDMSIMEILTIYLPIPLMLGIFEASTLMIAGVLYFFGINMLLWGKPYPRV